MYKVTMSSDGGTTRVFASGLTNKQAFDICVNYGWRFIDENFFEWYLCIEEEN